MPTIPILTQRGPLPSIKSGPVPVTPQSDAWRRLLPADEQIDNMETNADPEADAAAAEMDEIDPDLQAAEALGALASPNAWGP